MTSDFNSADSLVSGADDRFQTFLESEGIMSPAAITDSIDGPEDDQTPSPQPEGEKKATKKRKSWGQELPTPKTNLPPR